MRGQPDADAGGWQKQPAQAQAVVESRLLFGLSGVWFGYFLSLGVPQFGMEGARQPAERDPEFLELFERCSGEPERSTHLAFYAELSEQAVALFDEVRMQGATVLQLRDNAGVEPVSVQKALSVAA